jgi:hypothetical protein
MSVLYCVNLEQLYLKDMLAFVTTFFNYQFFIINQWLIMNSRHLATKDFL